MWLLWAWFSGEEFVWGGCTCFCVFIHSFTKPARPRCTLCQPCLFQTSVSTKLCHTQILTCTRLHTFSANPLVHTSSNLKSKLRVPQCVHMKTSNAPPNKITAVLYTLLIVCDVLSVSSKAMEVCGSIAVKVDGLNVYCYSEAWQRAGWPWRQGTGHSGEIGLFQPSQYCGAMRADQLAWTLKGPSLVEQGRRGKEQITKTFWKIWARWSGTWWLQMASFPPASCQLIEFNDVCEGWPVPVHPGSPCPSCPPRQQERQQHTNKAPHGTDWDVLKFPFTHSCSLNVWLMNIKESEQHSLFDNLYIKNQESDWWFPPHTNKIKNTEKIKYVNTVCAHEQ